jgi:hypothetical protein
LGFKSSVVLVIFFRLDSGLLGVFYATRFS